MKWKFIDTGYHPGSFNMEFDESLAIQSKFNSDSQILRVYGWHPPAISIGYNQELQDFDLIKLSDAGIDMIRRPTGGRAILHANELTYSVVMQMDNEKPKEIYQTVNNALLCGLKYLGIEACLTTSSDNFSKLYKDNISLPCFSTSAKSEIQHNGRKLIGSAQRRYGSVILQHGSFLLGPQHRNITDYFAPKIREMRSVIESALLQRTTDAKTILNRDVTYEEAANAIRSGFEYYYGMCFEISPSLDTIMQ